MDHWSGRVALVTGASGVIGAAIAEVLVKHGMKVVGCARNVESIQEMSGEKGKLYAKKCDLTKEEDILHMFKEIRSELGGVDVCINHAGVSHVGPLLTGEFSQWKNMMDVNVLGLALCTQEAVKTMTERNVDDGHIIHISSLVGHLVKSDMTFYSATKHAVKALTEGHRMELREMDSNIRVSSISPGFVKTEGLAQAAGEEIARQVYQTNPWLEARDVADAVVYILSAPQHVQVHDIIMRPTKQVF